MFSTFAVINLKAFLSKYHRLLFYAVWLMIHIIQAANTELFDDEAYYWVYSKFLDWGYFDHPPMIALLIKTGYCVFHSELGVRLLTIFFTTASLFVTEELLEKKNPFLFYAICGSVALAQIGGMLAVPDAPLMFFVAMFFFVYKRFVNNRTLVNALLLGLLTALMFYTKYHAVLILLFTGLSNLRLFKTYHVYVSCVFALLLFLPHIYWQHANGYPSVQFHLFERNSAEYIPWYTAEYIIGQILLTGPLMGWLLIIATLRHKPTSLSERALKFSFIGIYTFFLFSTLKGKAEVNWTIPSFIGLIVLSHQYLASNERLRKVLYNTLPLTLVMVIIGRIIMMTDLPPAWWILKDEFHDNRLLVRNVQARAKDKQVVFLDTYQKPSKYWFYSGDTAFGLNTPTYRRNNFNFWPIEETYNGKAAYVFGSYDKYFFNDGFILRTGEKNGGRLMPLYYSFSKVMIEDVEVNNVDRNKIATSFSVRTPEHYLTYFSHSPYDTASLYLAVYKKKTLFKYVHSNITVKDITRPFQKYITSFDLPLPAGEYTCKFALATCLPGRPSLNSPGFTVKVK